MSKTGVTKKSRLFQGNMNYVSEYYSEYFDIWGELWACWKFGIASSSLVSEIVSGPDKVTKLVLRFWSILAYSPPSNSQQWGLLTRPQHSPYYTLWLGVTLCCLQYSVGEV